MRLKTIAETLKSLLPTRQPIILWGPPGVGKSDIIRQTAAAMNVDLTDVRAVLLDPVDLRGLPYVTDGIANWAIPSFLPTKGDGILLLDEIDKAPPLVQSACLQLVLDRKIGEYKLPDGWFVMAAANRMQDRAGGHKMGTALSSRFLHLDVEVDPADWCDWALDAGIHGSIIGYIRWKGDALHAWGVTKDASADQSKSRKLSNANDRTFPSPRTWEFVSRVIDHITPTTAHEVVAGCVGPAAAAEYCRFLEIYRALPDPEAMLRDPDNCVMPEPVNVIWALSGFISDRVRNCDADTQGRAVRLLRRFPREFGLQGIQDCVIANRKVATDKEFVRWLDDDPKLAQAILGGAA